MQRSWAPFGPPRLYRTEVGVRVPKLPDKGLLVASVKLRQGWPVPARPASRHVMSSLAELQWAQRHLLATSVHWGISTFGLVSPATFPTTSPSSVHKNWPDKMRFSGISSLLLVAAGAVQAASSWSFDDGSVSTSSKKGGEAPKAR